MFIFAHVFEAQYVVNFLDGLIDCTVDDMILCHFFSPNTLSTYTCYIRVTRLGLKQTTVLPLPKELYREGAGTWSLGVTQVDNAMIYRLKNVEVILMLQATDVSVKNTLRPLHSILCHSTWLHIFSCRTFDMLTNRMQDVLPFRFLVSWRWMYLLRHQVPLLSRDRFSLRCTYSITVLVMGSAPISLGQSLAGIDCYQKSARRSIRRRRLRSLQ